MPQVCSKIHQKKSLYGCCGLLFDFQEGFETVLESEDYHLGCTEIRVYRVFNVLSPMFRQIMQT